MIPQGIVDQKQYSWCGVILVTQTQHSHKSTLWWYLYHSVANVWTVMRLFSFNILIGLFALRLFNEEEELMCFKQTCLSDPSNSGCLTEEGKFLDCEELINKYGARSEKFDGTPPTTDSITTTEVTALSTTTTTTTTSTTSPTTTTTSTTTTTTTGDELNLNLRRFFSLDQTK